MSWRDVQRRFWPAPRAEAPLITYRYPSAYGGWITIGARDYREALREANRSLSYPNAQKEHLEIWNADHGKWEPCEG